MKKINLLMPMFIMLSTFVFGQDYKKVQNAYLLGRVEDANTELDKLIANPKVKATDKAETFYWKGKILAALAKDEKTKAKYPNAFKDADEALTKYASLDTGYTIAKEKGTEAFFDLYSAYFNTGVTKFEGKQWNDAGVNFENAIRYINLVIEKKWTDGKITFDTTSTLYAAYAYQNAKNLDKAAQYYTILADKKIALEGYRDVYVFLVEYFSEKKDKVNFNKYLAIGREKFPQFEWDEYEVEFINVNLSLEEKSALYDQEDAAGKMSEAKYLLFGDIFAEVRLKEKESADKTMLDTYSNKAVDAYKKAFKLNPNNAIAAFNIGVTYYNAYGEIEEKYMANIQKMQEINSNKPVEKDPKKKAAAEAKVKEQLDPIKKQNEILEKPMMENVDNCIQWLENSFKILKDKPTRTNVEKSVINKSIDWLANMFEFKRNKMRGKDDKAFDALDAKFKEYDALHGKY